VAAPPTPWGDIMTQHISNHVLDGKGLNYDDYSFFEVSIPGAEKLKVKRCDGTPNHSRAAGYS